MKPCAHIAHTPNIVRNSPTGQYPHMWWKIAALATGLLLGLLVSSGPWVAK